MGAKRPGSQKRILVTGSRGKSSVVRLLYAAMQAAGLQTYARISGVVPRELGADGIRTISRSAGAHVEEMRWWLRQLPASAQGIVLENSAITPEYQALAGHWLRPQITVLTNTVPDHQELWGPTDGSAAQVLATGVPEHGQVVLPVSLNSDDYLLSLLKRRHCQVEYAEPASEAGESYKAVNIGLALAVLERLGFDTATALQTLLSLPDDRYDFHVADYGGAKVAMAFSANDITSTRDLFRSLKWSQGETRLIYNHRADRPGRFRSFIDWLSQSGWQEVLIIGDRPAKRLGSARYLNIKNKHGLMRLIQPGDRVFGCGNIAGIPMSLTAVANR